MDLACLTLGRWVENKLAERDKKGKPVHKLENLLREPDGVEASGVGEFRQFAPLARKIKVPESGIW